MPMSVAPPGAVFSAAITQNQKDGDFVTCKLFDSML
jgi:hypothetical protein